MFNPDWQDVVETAYRSRISNTFMFTGNIGDYAKDTVYLKDYLVSWALSRMNKDDVYIYDINSQGVSVKSQKSGIPFEEIINKITNPKGNDVFVFYYPEYIIPAGDYVQPDDKKRIVALHSAINSSNFICSSNMVFFITESASGINPMFLGNNSKISLYNIDLPDKDTRRDFIEYWWDKHANIKAKTRFVDTNFDVIANLTAGLQLISIEDIFLLASSIGTINNRMIIEKKKEIIRKEFGEVVEIFDTEGLSLSKFAGQEDIKNYFKEVVIDAIKDGVTDIVPKGVMLMGPPGTGKTFFAKCLAADSGISFVEFKLSKILGKYVGESEKAMEKALSVFRALAPVGVFMDEIDQSMSRGQGGSDGGSRVNANLFGMLLAEMSKPENRGNIIWIAATNYPNNVDEALKRPGRFDKKIPFFAPTKEERAAVFKLHLSNKDLPVSSSVNINELADKTDGYTQAEIEAIVVKALELAKRHRMKEITQDVLDTALEYMLSNQNEKIKEMEDIALKECNDQEFIPLAYRERQKELMRNNSVNSSFSNVDRGSSLR